MFFLACSVHDELQLVFTGLHAGLMLLAALSFCWMRLAALSFCWILLLALSFCWMLLAALSFSWTLSLLSALSFCWMLLSALSFCWMHAGCFFRPVAAVFAMAPGTGPVLKASPLPLPTGPECVGSALPADRCFWGQINIVDLSSI